MNDELEGWQSTDTAPRDGSKFLAMAMERAPFSPAPTYFLDIAWWHDSGNPMTSYFRSKSGSSIVAWHETSPIPSREALAELITAP